MFINSFFKAILHENGNNSVEKIFKLNIRCYGLGSVEENFNARYQLALLMLIVDKYESNERIQINKIEIFDPILNEIDKNFIRQITRFHLLEINDEAKCTVHIKNKQMNGKSNGEIGGQDTDCNGKDDNEIFHLFYMPHCGKALYNNLLYANWDIDNLNRLYIFGNSFKLIHDMASEHIDNYKFIKNSIKFLKEYQMPHINECQLTNAFSDLSLHRFEPQSEVDLKFDGHTKAPIYEDKDEEIVFAKK
jgi:hypothetical protein